MSLPYLTGVDLWTSLPLEKWLSLSPCSVFVMPRSRSPPKPTRRLSSVCEIKEPYSYTSLQVWTLCVQCIGMIGEPWAQLGLGFYHSKGRSGGFLRFRIPDWLTFVLVCPCEKWWVCPSRWSIMFGMLKISFGRSVLERCLNSHSLWSFLEPGIVLG